MNAYQLTQLEPKAIESMVYSNPDSTELELALSTELLEYSQFWADSDNELKTAEERIELLEATLENILIMIEENKPKKAVKLIYKESINAQ